MWETIIQDILFLTKLPKADTEAIFILGNIILIII